jgi:deoxyadenosine/deoxycytidine kinase
MIELLLSCFVIGSCLTWGIYRLTHPIVCTVSIDGLIGSGKSTLLDKLVKSSNDYVLLAEPLDIWMGTTDKDGKHILDKFYNDMPRWSYTFQSFAYITRIKLLKDAVDNIRKFKFNMTDICKRLFGIPYVIISERSIYTDRYIFAQMLYDDNKMSELEFEIYKTWFNFFDKDYKIDHVVYVRTTPENALKRIKTRGRESEMKLGIDYLESLYKYHENWLINFGGGKLNVIRLDDNNIEEDVNSEKSIAKYQNHIEKIKEFINKL